MNINWLNKKPINSELVTKYLSESLLLNKFTNGGPCVKYLESLLFDLLEVAPHKSLILVNNGTAALHAIISMFNLTFNRELKWATSSYTFPVSAQGPLKGSLIVDIDEDCGPDLTQIDPNQVDGIIVTNVLGHLTNLDKYQQWVTQHQKILILDNAATACSYYHNTNSINIGTASIISLHHTKPIGFGEGGIIIIDKEYENHIRKVINFGYDMIKMDQLWHPEGSNYKMSDIAAAYILQYLTNYQHIKHTHLQLYQQFLDGLKDISDVTPFPNYSERVPFVSCMPVIFSKKISLDEFKDYPIEIKKYYKPLNLEHTKSMDLYNRIICFPCNIDMKKEDVDYFLTILKNKITQLKADGL